MKPFDRRVSSLGEALDLSQHFSSAIFRSWKKIRRRIQKTNSNKIKDRQVVIFGTAKKVEHSSKKNEQVEDLLARVH